MFRAIRTCSCTLVPPPSMGPRTLAWWWLQGLYVHTTLLDKDLGFLEWISRLARMTNLGIARRIHRLGMPVEAPEQNRDALHWSAYHEVPPLKKPLIGQHSGGMGRTRNAYGTVSGTATLVRGIWKTLPPTTLTAGLAVPHW